jgi:hypothetical protein
MKVHQTRLSGSTTSTVGLQSIRAMFCSLLCKHLILVRLPRMVSLIEGGQTPINSGIELASRLLSEVPDLYHQLAVKVRMDHLSNKERN